MTKKRFLKACSVGVLLGFFAVIMVGCSGSSKPSKFYMLRSMEGSQKTLANASNGDSVSILVGPVTLPAYLDRTQMVTVAGKHELALDEFSRWAESLQDNFYRVLLEDLSSLLNTAQVYGYDRGGKDSADYQVVIDVTRFDSVPGGDAVLTAFWAVSGKDESASSIQYKSVFRAPVSGTGYPGVVDAQNQTLTAFSREIASAIQSLQK